VKTEVRGPGGEIVFSVFLLRVCAPKWYQTLHVRLALTLSVGVCVMIFDL
jgi:hypothetical protein